MLRKLVRVILLVLLLALGAPSVSVLAISNPDSISIESVRVFQNLWETDDQLYIVEYKIMYASDPSEEPEDTFFVGIWDGASLEYTRPVSYYDHCFTSIYLTAAQKLTWGSSYTIAVSGNPAYFSSITEDVNKDSMSLSSGFWIPGSGDESPDLVRIWCVQLAEVMETSWGLPGELLTDADTLNSTGTLIFEELIPGLVGVVPSLFQESASYPHLVTTTYDPVYEDSTSGRLGARLERAAEKFEDWLGIPGMTVIAGGIAILFFILVGRLFVSTGSSTAAIALGMPFLLAMAYLGVIPMSVLFVFALVIVILFGITFILGRLE